MCFSSANIDTLDNKNQLLVDIFLEYIQHNLPEGVSVIVQKVMQFTKELLLLSVFAEVAGDVTKAISYWGLLTVVTLLKRRTTNNNYTFYTLLYSFAT